MISRKRSGKVISLSSSNLTTWSARFFGFLCSSSNPVASDCLDQLGSKLAQCTANIPALLKRYLLVGASEIRSSHLKPCSDAVKRLPCLPETAVVLLACLLYCLGC